METDTCISVSKQTKLLIGHDEKCIVSETDLIAISIFSFDQTRNFE